MAMKRWTANNLSTLLYDAETGDSLIRVSVWVDPRDLELESDDDGPTIAVRARKGRTTIFGKVDTKAYKTWLTKDEPPAEPSRIPMPTDDPRVNRSKVLAKLI